jgi:BON domain
MTPTRSSFLGAGIGATSMFLLDPARGARRRALIRDKMAWARRKTADAAEATWNDVGNRVVGLQSRTRALFTHSAVDDATLTAKVRAALGRVTAYQRAVSITARNGCVTLSGDALASEVASIVSAVGRVPGVFGVETDLRTHSSSDRVPMLQGSRRPGQWRTWLRSSWSPAALMATGAAIAIAGATIARKRDLIASGAKGRHLRGGRSVPAA